MRARIAVFLVIVQSILLLVHWLIYHTWTTFRAEPASHGVNGLRIVLVLLALSFVCASLLAFRTTSVFAHAFYRLAAVWLGAVNFLFLAACACWIVLGIASISRVRIQSADLALWLFGLAAAASSAAVINARWIREKRIVVSLRGLPPAWKGRVAALVSDVHLGHVNSTRFMKRVVGRLSRLKPDIVFITGDLYDGTKVDAPSLASSLKEFSPPLGSYFVTGNHEEFSDPSAYVKAVRNSGVRVLMNENVVVDGMQVVGVNHHDTTDPKHYRAVLQHLGIDRNRPSILLSHSPHALNIAEEAGISLQLSGHTHGGQIFPFTWFTRRIFHAYTYGLNRFRNMLVYTTFGVGTWGPPMRLGTWPEIVLIEFA